MILRPIRWALSAFTTMVFLYVFFFVPIGRRTLFDYARRIAATPEAQDFGHEMRGAGERVVDTAEHEFRTGLTLPGAMPDAAASPLAPIEAHGTVHPVPVASPRHHRH